jgi:N6-L-threonylcarbamoyladenine synthase
MIILGIESSCDETAAAVIENMPSGGVRLLSNVTATSAGIHARTGGVIPEDAARKQVESIIPVIEVALKDAFPSSPLTTNYQLLTANVDAIAVTVGPGLIGSLLVGVETAKALACVTGKPIIPVNHLVGHLYANWIVDGIKNYESGIRQKNLEPTLIPDSYSLIPTFPALALVVSGGHTDLVLMKDHGKFEWIGGTRDDAAGEAFDKTARLMGFDYPGGPLLSKAADSYLAQLPTANYQLLNLFPRPMIHEPNFDWSFSGLKTAVLRTMKDLVGETVDLKMADYQRLAKLPIVIAERSRLAAEIQEAIVDVIVEKVLRAVDYYKPSAILLAGGVSANNRLREHMKERLMEKDYGVNLFVPKPILCTDNAAYIATCAFYNQKFVDWKDINANPELGIMDGVY